MPDVSRRKVTATSIHVMALDGIVNVNSLFTLALFIGITSSNTNNTLVDGACVAELSISRGLVTYHVCSFSSFLFSSLIALAVKQVINIGKGDDEVDALDTNEVRLRSDTVSFIVKVNAAALRLGILISAFGSVFGCGFLVVALINFVQIKLGTLACGSHYTLVAIGPLLVLVPTALLIYIVLVLYAFTR